MIETAQVLYTVDGEYLNIGGISSDTRWKEEMYFKVILVTVISPTFIKKKTDVEGRIIGAEPIDRERSLHTWLNVCVLGQEGERRLYFGYGLWMRKMSVKDTKNATKGKYILKKIKVRPFSSPPWRGSIPGPRKQWKEPSSSRSGEVFIILWNGYRLTAKHQGEM